MPEALITSEPRVQVGKLASGVAARSPGEPGSRRECVRVSECGDTCVTCVCCVLRVYVWCTYVCVQMDMVCVVCVSVCECVCVCGMYGVRMEGCVCVCGVCVRGV